MKELFFLSFFVLFFFFCSSNFDSHSLFSFDHHSLLNIPVNPPHGSSGSERTPQKLQSKGTPTSALTTHSTGANSDETNLIEQGGRTDSQRI
jgi:hypothetical protein